MRTYEIRISIKVEAEDLADARDTALEIIQEIRLQSYTNKSLGAVHGIEMFEIVGERC